MKLKDLLREGTEWTVSQQDLLKRVKNATKKGNFIKNLVAGLVPTKNLTPDILAKIGSVDETTYTPEYMVANPYTLIQFDPKTQKLDMYAPSIAVLKSDYKYVEPTELIKKNLAREGLAGLADLKYVAKKAVVEMVKIVDMGIEPNTVIESPWGVQTAFEGAYIVNGGDQAYVVNKEEGGVLPIGYIPA